MNTLDDPTMSTNTELKWSEICKPGAIVILFYDSFTSAKRAFVAIKTFNEADGIIVTAPNSNEQLPVNIQIGIQYVAQISMLDGAVRFPINLISINESSSEYTFKLPSKHVMIKHHNSLRVNLYVSGTIFSTSGENLVQISEPLACNLSNTGLRIVLDECPLKLRGRYFIVLMFKFAESHPIESAFSLKCKWSVSRIREFNVNSKPKFEVAGYFIYEDTDRDKLEAFLSQLDDV